MSSDAPQTIGVYDLLAWLEVNKKPLIIGFAAAVVVGFGIATYRYSANQKEVAASDALLKLKTSLSAGDGVTPQTAGAYLQVAQEYPGTTAAERAQLLGGTSLFAEGKYAEAQEQFVKFVREHPQNAFASTAAYGSAASLEAQGKRDEALAAYQNLSVRYPGSTVLDDAKLAIGRIHEAKNEPEQAFRAYEELIKAGVMTTAGSEAVQRKNLLLIKHPEFAKTNAPAVSATLPLGASTNLPAAAGTNPAPAKP